MKKGFTSLEMHFLVKELQDLKDTRVDRIYHPEHDCLIFQLFVSSRGKRLLKILFPGFMFLTNSKAENPEKPSEFCLQMRKYLDNAFLRSVQQKDSERITELVFEKRDEKYILIVELFSKGNSVLCDKDYKIIVPLYAQKWSQRTIKRGEIYVFPSSAKNIFSIKEKEFCDILANSQKDSIVKALAVDMGIGGSYAEELCLISSVDKHTKSVSDKELRDIFSNFQKLLTKPVKPCVVYDTNGMALDIVPFDLELYKNFGKQCFASYSEALDFAILQEVPKEQKQLALKIEKLQRILNQQQKDIQDMQERLEKEQKSADLLYSHYQLVSEIINEIKKASVKYSWKEIQEKLKGHKVVKEVNAKDKMLILELG